MRQLCRVTLESGRDFMFNPFSNDPEEIAQEALEEAALYDDYLTDLEIFDA